MAIFVNSWPAGIALSLLTLPLIGTAYGVRAVCFAVAAMIGFGLVLCRYLSAASELPDRHCDIRTARPPRCGRRDRGGPDLGPL
jgi:hypothetical protein